MSVELAPPIQELDKPSLNPITPSHALEFGGHIATPILVFLTPLTVYALYFTCSSPSGCPAPLSAWAPNFLSLDWLQGFINPTAFVIYGAWYAFCVAAWKLLPGEWVDGTVMRDGQRKSYKINAWSTLLLALGLTTGRIIHAGAESFTFLYDNYLGLITASIAMSVGQALWVQNESYKGDQNKKLMAVGGNSGRFWYDFWMGRELNPSIGSFDIKTFNELRPGLILWMLIDISCACEQYCRLGGRITATMAMVVAFHSFYVMDALYNESAIFTQMDITTDGFGYMLSFGDLAWVPFTYSLQARYLAFHPTELSVPTLAAILAIQSAGYYIFRTANGEKNEFRLGRNPKNLTSMETARGTKLLTSGWWGRSRHPNYFGDWLMAWAWCLPAGFETPIPYFYVVYFGILLVHRQIRDDEQCKLKYGKDWDEYCKRVPYKIIPYIY